MHRRLVIQQIARIEEDKMTMLSRRGRRRGGCNDAAAVVATHQCSCPLLINADPRNTLYQ